MHKKEHLTQFLNHIRDRERMKGKDPFSGRGKDKGLPTGKSMDGDGSSASSGNQWNWLLLMNLYVFLYYQYYQHLFSIKIGFQHEILNS